MMMKRAMVAALIGTLAMTLFAGAALALNAIDCEGSGIRCFGTDRADLMKGTDGLDAMYGRDKGDTLKGFGEGDALVGQKGNDTLIGGTNQDLLIGGEDADRLRGEDPLDIYYFERSRWGRDAIIDSARHRNILRLPDRDSFDGSVTTNLDSDSGPRPEVVNTKSGSTVNWKGDVIAIVAGSAGDDTIKGNDARNDIFDEERNDTDTVIGAGGNDLLDVHDGAGDDKVECGEGHDTVYFDQDIEMVDPEECEDQNPVPSAASGRERATPYATEIPEQTPALGHPERYRP